MIYFLTYLNSLGVGRLVTEVASSAQLSWPCTQTCILAACSSQKVILSSATWAYQSCDVPIAHNLLYNWHQSKHMRQSDSWFAQCMKCMILIHVWSAYKHTHTHTDSPTGCVWDWVNPTGKSHIKGECCYSAFSPARLISYPLWPPGCLPSPPSLLFVLRKIPLSKWEYGVGASDTKVKTHLSCLNKPDKEMLYELPPESSPKSHGEQSGHNV